MTATSAQFDEPASCPFVADDRVRRDEGLRLAFPKRMVVQYLTNAEGNRELHLFYGERHVSFDEPHLFAFGENLARQGAFQADAALEWGDGYTWSEIGGLLAVLIDEEILERADTASPLPVIAADRSRPSPLAASVCPRPRTWDECEAITRDLTGVAVETGYLELIVPIFRVAHIALDDDGRQVGEANVFPRALRLDVPTDWMTCIYAGTRFGVDRPMNVTALKAMRQYWPQMMAALKVIRRHYLARFPGPSWTIGRLERLATLVLAVPSYQLMREDRPERIRLLHPVLSSLFRVTDGLRMALHQMLFVPIGEPALSPHKLVTADEIHAYAERNYSFHSETGVCAGPRHMVQEFLRVLMDGDGGDDAVSFDPAVETALAEMDAAFDYGLMGLQAHAAIFSLWPAMGRCYEAAADISAAAVQAGVTGLEDFSLRMAGHVETMKRSTFIGDEAWRLEREAVYADMFDSSALRGTTPSLNDLLSIAGDSDRASIAGPLACELAETFACTDRTSIFAAKLAGCFTDFLMRLRAILRVATSCQAQINSHLGRSQPTRSFGSAEINVHTLLQGRQDDRLPYLVDELASALDLRFSVDSHKISWASERPAEIKVPSFGRHAAG